LCEGGAPTVASNIRLEAQMLKFQLKSSIFTKSSGFSRGRNLGTVNTPAVNANVQKINNKENTVAIQWNLLSTTNKSVNDLNPFRLPDGKLTPKFSRNSQLGQLYQEYRSGIIPKGEDVASMSSGPYAEEFTKFYSDWQKIVDRYTPVNEELPKVDWKYLLAYDDLGFYQSLKELVEDPEGREIKAQMRYLGEIPSNEAFERLLGSIEKDVEDLMNDAINEDKMIQEEIAEIKQDLREVNAIEDRLQTLTVDEYIEENPDILDEVYDAWVNDKWGEVEDQGSQEEAHHH